MVADPQSIRSQIDSEAIRLAGRITYGVNRQTAEAVRRMGYQEFIEWQLDYESIDNQPLEDALHAELPTLSMNAADLAAYLRNQDPPKPGLATREALVATVLRRAFSPRQLYERMVEFWSDLFNVPVTGAIEAYLKPIEDRDVIRPLAMGTFGDLLLADARSPAMLYYLDNFNSTADGPNENYARELMELHTLGVKGGFSETDVKGVARILTGWSFRAPATFTFRPFIHDYGAKEVLGRNFPAGVGQREGQELLALLASHPSTAVHIATKLVRRFVSDQPDEELVAAVAGTFSSSGGDTRELLRTLLLHPKVRSAPPLKLKRPTEFVAGVLRGLEVAPGENLVRAALGALESSGHVPFDWPAPNGYPDVRPYWQSSTGFLVRFNTASEWTNALTISSPLLNAARALRNAGRQVDYLAAALVPQGIAETSRQAIAGHAATLPNFQRPAAIAALLLSGPENQWR